jgi:hypothetical protein
MAHRGNIDFILYTGFDSDAANSYEAYDFMQTTGIQFNHLHYNNPQAIDTMLHAIKTWFPDEASLKVPFVTYNEAYDWNDAVPRVVKVVVGLNNIKATDWNALFTFRG